MPRGKLRYFNPYSRSFFNILKKIKFYGFSWTLNRLIEEFFTPSTRTGKILNGCIYPFFFILLFPAQLLCLAFSSIFMRSHKTLYLFYDLSCSPLTYDFFWALAEAESRRIRMKLKKIEVIIVPGRDQGLRREIPAYDFAVNREKRCKRIFDILLPAVKLFPNCKGVSICQNRLEGFINYLFFSWNIAPGNYNPIFPIPHQTFQAVNSLRHINGLPIKVSEDMLSYVKNLLPAQSKGKKLIVITLREYSYLRKRNSNTYAWIKFAKNLDKKKYFPIFIRDIDRRENRGTAFPKSLFTFDLASTKTLARAALYQLGYLNLGVSSGPFILCWLNSKAKYLMFNLSKDMKRLQSQTPFFRVGGSLAFAQNYQNWVWEEDKFEIINKKFKEICDQIEGKK